jgi:arabinose-5-phosphate isomerase
MRLDVPVILLSTIMPDTPTPRRSPDAIPFEQLGRETIELEAEALAALARRIDADFARACELILAIPGRVIVVGMGKSGHVGGKIAATLASTGTPAFFVHPGEASHGDLGMITPHDLVLAISNSGETDEILLILPIIKRMGAKLVALTGNPASTLARRPTRSCTARLPRRHARSTSRPPRAPPRRSPWATRWPWRFSSHAASRARTSRVRIRRAAWGDGSCSTSATSCTPAPKYRSWARTPGCARRCSR